MWYGHVQGHLMQLGVSMNGGEDSEDHSLLRRALLKGLFQNTARRQPDGRYRLYSTSQVCPSGILSCSWNGSPLVVCPFLAHLTVVRLCRKCFCIQAQS